MMSYAEDDYLEQKSPDGNQQHKQSILQIERQESNHKQGEEKKVIERQVSQRSIHKITSSFSQEEDNAGDQMPKGETYNFESESSQGDNLDPLANQAEDKLRVVSENEAPPPSSLADHLLKDIQHNFLDETMDSDCLNKDLD